MNKCTCAICGVKMVKPYYVAGRDALCEDCEYEYRNRARDKVSNAMRGVRMPTDFEEELFKEEFLNYMKVVHNVVVPSDWDFSLRR